MILKNTHLKVTYFRDRSIGEVNGTDGHEEEGDKENGTGADCQAGRDGSESQT